MSRPSLFRLSLVLAICLALGSCYGATPPPPAGLPEKDTDGEDTAASPAEPPVIAETWKELWEKLDRDGLGREEIAYLFVRLGDNISQVPMGSKVHELYNRNFLSRPVSAAPIPESSDAEGIPKPWYRGFVTDANARRCRAFINDHARTFQAAREKYGVPAEVAAALLFVETRLGEYLGEHNAFIVLASMAAARDPQSIPDWLSSLPGVEKRMDWVGRNMRERADRAYSELHALLIYCLENGVDPFEIPSSVYGAFGLCQFMPSNLPRFAVDGDGDGIIDLFAPEDAVASLGNYLAKHGWKTGLSVAESIKVLRRYNNSATYANTILALARLIREIPGRPAVNRPLYRPSTAVSAL